MKRSKTARSLMGISEFTQHTSWKAL